MTHQRAAIRTLALAGALVISWTQFGPGDRTTRAAGSEVRISTEGKVVADQGGVSAEHPLAVQAGLEMLHRGGNAVDAMVATALAMTVVRNGANGLGGYGGAMLIHRRDLAAPVVVDFNTRAPLAAVPDMFYTRRTDATSGILSVTTWNTVAGLAVALEQFGTMKWTTVIQPAIRYAEQGFVIGADYARALRSAEEKFRKWPTSKSTYSRRDGGALQEGDRFVQAELAQSLRTLATEGPDAIYTGQLARRMVDYIRAERGIVTIEDLAEWRQRHVRLLKPAHTTYRGYDVYTAPINTGGQNLIAILNLLKEFDLPSAGFSALSVHHMLEAYKLAFADRLWYLGDPWMVEAPYAGIMSEAYAQERRKLIDADIAWPYARPGDPWKYNAGGLDQFLVTASGASSGATRREGSTAPDMSERRIPAMAPEGDTASTAAMDKDGNMVALTMTLRSMFGSGVTVPGTGITLNDGMGLFHPTEGDPEPLAAHPNRLQGGKLGLNNMAPFLVLRKGHPLVTGGGSGGRRIMTECLAVIVRLLDWKMDVQAAVDAPRFHVEQKQPSLVEDAFPYGIASALQRKGHQLEAGRRWGAMHVIQRDLKTGQQHVARESRQDVSAAGGLVSTRQP